MLTLDPKNILPTETWLDLQRSHLHRASLHTAPARARRDRGVAHPIDDFLFQYYPYPFSFLENWQPGFGMTLAWELDEPLIRLSKYHRQYDKTVFADPELLSEKEKTRLLWIHDLLVATRSRPANFACHGLHEWAMVYGGTHVRHEGTTALRLPQEEIDALVRTRPIVCSHYDAFRFFEPTTQPLNRLQPNLQDRPKMEQPGCIHANMDLYKWAAKSMPWIGSELLLDCFELAIELRDLDMRASPYDLSAWERPPVKIETPEGRKEYEAEQKRLADRAVPLRDRLINALAATLSLT